MTRQIPASVAAFALTVADRKRLAIDRPHNEAFSNRGGGLALALAPRSEAELMAAMSYLADLPEPFTVHSTGHSFAGLSVQTRTVLTLARLTECTLDKAGILYSSGGARVLHANAELAPANRAISTGTNPWVGLVGLSHGGGAAYTTRLHGLTCDALIGARLLTYSGDVLDINEESSPEILWALRGGGAGALGVTVQAQFRTYPTYDVASFSIRLGTPSADLIARLEEMMIAAPRELAFRVAAVFERDAEAIELQLSGQHQHAHYERFTAFLAEWIGHPDHDYLPLRYHHAMAGAAHQSAGGAYRIIGTPVSASIGVEGYEVLLDALQRRPRSSNPDGAGFNLFSWGGAVADMPAEASCFPWRQTEHLMSIDTSWTTDDGTATIDRQHAWLNDTRQALTGRLPHTAYVNFPDLGTPGVANSEVASTLNSLFGPNRERLTALVNHLNPTRAGESTFAVFEKAEAACADLKAPA